MMPVYSIEMHFRGKLWGTITLAPETTESGAQHAAAFVNGRFAEAHWSIRLLKHVRLPPFQVPYLKGELP